MPAMQPEHHHEWVPDAPPPEDQRTALLRLATALRTTIDLVMDTDAVATDLDGAAAALEEWNLALARHPRGRPLYGYAEAANATGPTPFKDSSPVSGPINPLAPPVDMRFEGGIVVATATLGIPYEGPPGHVHGGVTSLIFDEVLGKVQSLSGAPGMTGRLTIHYRQPTPLGIELTFRGYLDRVEGRKIFTRGTLHAGDPEQLCAEAEGLFISVPRDRLLHLARG
jgi:acyl-coenzyme A thioesterase PaaI-like protein